jgi:predicted amidohydrolase YtcJ
VKWTLVFALALTACVHRMPDPTHTVVFVAKTIHTLDPARPHAQALAMRDGKLLAVGSLDEVLTAAGPDAAIERFPASTIVPGLVDAHAHLASLGRAMAIVSLNAATSEETAVELLQKTATKAAYQGDWLVGRGWDQNDWTVKALPTRALLDRAFPTTPVLLTRVDGHAAWVNGEALRRAGLSAATIDPPGGRLLRDSKGELTGVLVDNAIDLVTPKLPPLATEELRHRLKLALEWCAKLGLTGVHDAGMDYEVFQLLQQWDLVGALPLRVYAMADGQGAQADEFLGRGLFHGRRLELRAVKFLLDGALGSRGAALLAPYTDEPSQSGLLLLTREELEARAEKFAAAGFQVAVHAIGDRANRVVIDVLAALEARHPGGRHRVEHAQVLAAAEVPRFAQHNLVASYQPTHATSDMPWAEDRLGVERARFAYAWSSVLKTGAHVAFGSDFPVEHPNPLWGLYAARTRQDSRGQPPGGWHPDERVTGEQALAGFTTGAAWASFSEERRGALKAGADADFVVLPVDPVDGPAAALLDAQVQVTVVDGIDVYRAPSRSP